MTARGKDFFSMEEIQTEFDLSPTVFTNQIRNQKFPHEIEWISPEIFPGESVSETSEGELLQKLVSNQEKMQKEIGFYFFQSCAVGKRIASFTGKKVSREN